MILKILKYRRLIALTLLLPSTYLTANPTTNESGSMVYSIGGTAQVNGAAVGESAALLDGNILDAGNSALSITRQGSTIAVRAKSKLIIRENDLHLGCGDVTVRTMNGMSTLLWEYRVKPSALAGRYEVIQGLDNAKIISLEGNTVVYAGNQQLTVPAGQMLSFPSKCLDDAVLRSTATESPSTSSRNIPAAKFSRSAAIITVTGAALATSAVLVWHEIACCGRKKKPISPVSP